MTKLTHIINTLASYYSFNLEESRPYRLSQELTSFEFLVLTVLNQNTTDILADRAFSNILSACGRPITPTAILNLGIERIANLIRVSGMYRRKAETIFDLAEKVLRAGGEHILDRGPIEVVISLLRSVRGLGDKSIDVFLLFKRNYPTFPVDTHIKRICSRLGIEKRPDYAKLRMRFLSELGQNVYLLKLAHLVLIHHGKVTCKARVPKCDSCPINVHCWSYLERSGRAKVT